MTAERGNAQMRGPGGAGKVTPELAQLPSCWATSTQYLSKALKSENQQGKIEVHLELARPGGQPRARPRSFLPAKMPSIRQLNIPASRKIAATIRDLPNTVRLEGHTDFHPHPHREAVSQQLGASAARSIATMALLSNRYATSHAAVWPLPCYAGYYSCRG